MVVAVNAPRRVEVQLRNPQAATVAPTPMPGRPAALANQTPVMPVQTPMAIAAGRAPVTAPEPAAVMSGVNDANAYAMQQFAEHHNAWDSAAQGFVNGSKFQEDAAKEQAKNDEAAKLLGDNPDLVAAVKAGTMDPNTAYGVAQQRTAAAKLELRKTRIVDYLKASGDHDIADQYVSGVLDEDGVASAVAAKDKSTKVTPTDEQRLLSQINDERKATGKPEMSMEDFLASKKGTAPIGSADSDLSDLPTVQVDEKGIPDAGQQDAFLSNLDPQTSALVKKIANYEMDVSKVTSLKGGERQKIAALVAQYDPTFDMNQYTTRARTKIAYATGQQGQTITAANTAIGHLGALYDDFTTMNNGPINAITGLANAAKGQMSDANLAKLRTNKAAAAEELAKFFKGSGASDMTTIGEWMAKLDENMGTDAMHEVIKDTIDKLLKSRLDEMEGQYRQVMGRPADFKVISAETAGVLEKMGIKASDLDPNNTDAPGGDTAPDAPAAPEYPDGTVISDGKKQMIMKSGKWEDMPK